MKKQINHRINAYFIRGAFYLLLFIAACAVPLGLAQRDTSKLSAAQQASHGTLNGAVGQTASPSTIYPLVIGAPAGDQTAATETLCSKIAFSSDRDGNTEIYVMN